MMIMVMMMMMMMMIIIIIIINNFGRLQELIFAFKFSWACGIISSKCIETLALCPPKASPALSYTD